MGRASAVASEKFEKTRNQKVLMCQQSAIELTAAEEELRTNSFVEYLK